MNDKLQDEELTNHSQLLSASIEKMRAAIDAMQNSDQADALRGELKSLLEASERSSRAANKAAENILGPNPMLGGPQGRDLVDTAWEISKRAISQPKTTLTHIAMLGQEFANILLGNSEVAPKKGDRRFSDTTWNNNPVYKRVMQGYLAWAKQVTALASDVMDSEEDKRRAKFLTSLLTDAAAPTNTIANPSALKRAIETGGASLVTGVKHMVEDFENNGGMPSMVDRSPFEVGVNVACTAGQIVFRNALLELIQYAPSGEKIYKRPTLFVPAQINKYYVMDLSPEKSLMKYMSEQGFQMFAISWKNPEDADRDNGLEAYVKAVKEAIDAICEICAVKDINLLGTCSGGITTAVTLANMAALGEDAKVKSLTLMVAMLDMKAESDMSLFASQEAILEAKERSEKKGCVEGSEMARAFAWMRPNDLIWNYWVNNYLMGNTPPAFDVLFWNGDTTRLTAKLHSDYLDIFLDNALVKDEVLEVNGTKINLGNIKCDYYCLAGITDHLTPWKTCFESQKLLGGKGRFVLSNLGHVQTLVCPPSNPKAKYFVNDDLQTTPEKWLDNAKLEDGSWWLDWGKWLAKQSGQKVENPGAQGSKKHPPLCPAPGTYVHE